MFSAVLGNEQLGFFELGALGAENYAYTGSGTLATSGSTTHKLQINRNATGTLTTSGSTTHKLSFSRTASGTVATSGSSARHISISRTISGTLTTSGSTTHSLSNLLWIYSGSGTVATSGTSNRTITIIRNISGTVLTSGGSLDMPDYPYTGSGTVAITSNTVYTRHARLVFAGNTFTVQPLFAGTVNGGN